MCLAIPMRVLQVDGLVARCEAQGVERTVSLFLLQQEPVVPGDQLMVHLGHAVDKISEDAAKEAWALFGEILASPPPER